MAEGGMQAPAAGISVPPPSVDSGLPSTNKMFLHASSNSYHQRENFRGRGRGFHRHFGHRGGGFHHMPFRNRNFNSDEPFNLHFDGKRLRKNLARRTVDYNCSLVKHLQRRVWQKDYRDNPAIQPDACYYSELVPPQAFRDNPINCVTTKFVRTSTNKIRCPIFCLCV